MESTHLLHTEVPVLSRRQLVTVEPVQFLYSLYFAGNVPLISQFVRSQLERWYNSPISHFVCGVTYNNSDTNRIEEEASTWLIYMNVAGMVQIF